MKFGCDQCQMLSINGKKRTTTMTEETLLPEQRVIALLWDLMRKSVEYPDRVDLPLGYNTKTKQGLLKVLEREMAPIFATMMRQALMLDDNGVATKYPRVTVEMVETLYKLWMAGK